MATHFSTLKAKVTTRVTRDGIQSALRYYFMLLRHATHYAVYDRRHDRLDAHSTSGFIRITGDDAIGSVQDLEGRGYQAFPRLPLLWSIQALGIRPASFSFIDYGSGRGRVLLTAARLPFRRVIGVEFVPMLHNQALENIARYPRQRLACREVISLNMDAVDYEPPAGNLITFFYNPFNAKMLDKVVDRILAARQHGRRAVYVIFANSDRMPLFVDRPEFTPLRLELFDRMRLRLFGTVPIEFFRLDETAHLRITGRLPR